MSIASAIAAGVQAGETGVRNWRERAAAKELAKYNEEQAALVENARLTDQEAARRTMGLTPNELGAQRIGLPGLGGGEPARMSPVGGVPMSDAARITTMLGGQQPANMSPSYAAAGLQAPQAADSRLQQLQARQAIYERNKLLDRAEALGGEIAAEQRFLQTQDERAQDMAQRAEENRQWRELFGLRTRETDAAIEERTARAEQIRKAAELSGIQIEDARRRQQVFNAYDELETAYRAFDGTDSEFVYSDAMNNAPIEAQRMLVSNVTGMSADRQELVSDNLRSMWRGAGTLQDRVNLFSNDTFLTPEYDFDLVPGEEEGTYDLYGVDKDGNRYLETSGTGDDIDGWMEARLDSPATAAAYETAATAAMADIRARLTQNEIDFVKAKADLIQASSYMEGVQELFSNAEDTGDLLTVVDLLVRGGSVDRPGRTN